MKEVLFIGGLVILATMMLALAFLVLLEDNNVDEHRHIGVLIQYYKDPERHEFATKWITTLNDETTITQADVQALLGYQVDKEHDPPDAAHGDRIVDIIEVYLPAATIIGDDAFQRCSSLIKADFPNVATIGNDAFQFCYALADANFPNASAIGTEAFNDCTALIKINFPEATMIQDTAFSGCHLLVTADFPKVTTIGETAFNSCFLLANVNFPKVTSISENAFSNCYKLGEKGEAIFNPQTTWFGTSIVGDDIGTSLGRNEARLINGEIRFNPP